MCRARVSRRREGRRSSAPSIATFAGFVDEPCQLLELSNQVLVERAGPSTIFVTAVVAVLRPREGRLTWASAGHPPPVLLDSGELLNGRKPTPPLGIGSTITCRGDEMEIAPSAGVLLFTDGVTEAHRPREELFGERRLAHTVRQLAGSPPEAVIRGWSRPCSSTQGSRLPTISVSSRPAW